MSTEKSNPNSSKVNETMLSINDEQPKSCLTSSAEESAKRFDEIAKKYNNTAVEIVNLLAQRKFTMGETRAFYKRLKTF